MTEPRAGIRGPILVLALVTLAVTALRVYGEMNGWDARAFNAKPGGPMSWVGIVWLVPIAGIVLGWTLPRRGGAPPNRALAVLLPLLAVVPVFLFFMFTVPKEEGGPAALPFRALVPLSWLVFAVSAWIATRGWKALGRANLVYGLCARVPVAALTVYALMKGWTETHLVGVAPFAPQDMSTAEKLFWLCGAQIFSWIPFTIIVGGVFGGLAGLFARRTA